MDTLISDLKYGARVLLKCPGFTIVAVLTLALGVGANTAIFSVVHAVLMSPLPYANADRVVLVKELIPQIGPQPALMSAPDIAQVARLNHVFDHVAGFRVWTYEFSGKGYPARLTADRVGRNLFPALGVQPVLGRTFTAEEELPGHEVIILSYGMWQLRFGGDPKVAGQIVNLDRKPYTIIGVMPQSFVFPLPGMDQGMAAEAWVPLALSNAELGGVGDNFDYGVVAKLKPGVTMRQANADLELVAQGVFETYRQWAREAHQSLGDMKLGIVPQLLADQVIGPVKPMLLMLLGAVGFVLLIACINVANLLLTRAADRQKEMAVRLAMGAGRFRLLRQLLVEGLLLSFLGGSVGLFLALWIKDALVAGIPSAIPQFHAIELDVPVLLFTFALAAITGTACAIFPALSATRIDLNHSLKEGGRGATFGREHQRLRGVLVVVEVALSVVLLIGAGLLVRSFQRVLETNPGFRPEHVLTANIDLPPDVYQQDPQVISFYKQLLQRLREAPGVIAVGGSSDLPLMGGWTHLFTAEGYQPPPGAGLNVCNHSVINEDYLQAMGVRLHRGRYFTNRDTEKSTHVLIVSEALATQYWPGQDPLGKRLKWGPPESNVPWMTVVGVVDNVKQGPVDVATTPHTYEPYLQLGSALTGLRIAVRTEGDPAALTAGLRSAVAGLDPQLAIGRIRTMEEVMNRSTAARRFNLFLLASFAALALVLAAIGIYGVLAYAVTRRTHEIGVRMALGARHPDVLRLVLGQGARVTLFGIVLGVAGAMFLTRFLQDMLYEVRPTDPATFGGVILTLAAVAPAASYIPARRATQVDPMQSLRHE
jgi:putative ABC transport system permease protein